MRSDLLIYGVTGLTGAMISRQAAAAGVPHVAAGRDLETVTAHADRLMLPARTVPLSEPSRLDRALQGVAVVLNAAPFAETALPLAEACLRGGVHYLDLSTRVAEIEPILRLDARGREAGVMLLPGVGGGMVVADALAARLKRRLPSALRLRLVYEAAGVSYRRGALQRLRDLREPGVHRRDGELAATPQDPQKVRVDLGEGLRTAVSDPWRGEQLTTWWSSVYADIDTYTVMPAALRWLLVSARLPGLGRLVTGPPGHATLRWAARRLPVGPDEAQLAAGRTHHWAQAEDAGGARVTARLRGPEEHRLTARVALWIARRVLEGRVRVGFQTPVTAFGPDLLDRILADVEGVELLQP